MVYVYIESHTEIRDGQIKKWCGWTIAYDDVRVPSDRTIKRVAGPFNGQAACDEWINTEGIKISGGKRRGQEWEC